MLWTYVTAGTNFELCLQICMRGIDDKTFQVLMEYMRTGHADINVQNVIDVYHAANSLHMAALETACWNKVFEKEPMERSLPAWIAAKRLNMPNEEKQLFRYITHNFDQISKTESFYELDATQLKEILRADVIKAEDELALYKAAINWVQYDCKGRAKYASSLVEAIRFQDMTPAQVEGFNAVKVCPEVQKQFDVSQRLPQPGQKKQDKGREYAQVQKVAAGEGIGHLPAPSSQRMTAATAPLKPSVAPLPSQEASTPHLVPPAEAPVPKQLSANVVYAAPPPQQQPLQKPQQPMAAAAAVAPLVLSLEQQAAVLSPAPEEKPQPKLEVKKTESVPQKKEESKEKVEVVDKKHDKQPKDDAKSTSKESKKGASKDKIKKKHSKEKKPGEPKSETGGGGGGHKREPHVNASKVKKPSAEGPGGGAGKNDLKSNASKAKNRVSRKSQSESSGLAKSSGKSSKSSTVPKRKPDKDRGKSDLGVAGKKSSSGAGRTVHRKARSANRLSSGGSDLSLVTGKMTSRNIRDKRRQRLTRVPHRALSETQRTSDPSYKGLDCAATGDQQLVIALLGGLAADSKGANLESAAIFSLGPEEDKWKCVGRMPRPRYGHQAVVYHDYIYVVGGFEVGNDGRQLATTGCHRFSMSRSCWETMGSLRRARCHHGVAVVLGKVYAVGGQSVNDGFMDSVEVYDPDLDRWSEVTPLCCARMAANAVEFRGQMWHHKASLPLPVCNCSLVAHRGRLLAVGGLVRTLAEGSLSQQPMAPIADVLEYSVANDSWSRISIMPVRAHSVGLASLGEDVYILGGQLADDAGTATRNAYRYNPVTDRWVTLPPLPMRLSQACAVIVRKQAFK
ncbi:hypothetical protein MRX96_059051 [Rhipicephalus microplus]